MGLWVYGHTFTLHELYAAKREMLRVRSASQYIL